jgi:hypothetical protein
MTDHAAELRQWFGPHPATEAAIAEIARLRAENERFRTLLEEAASNLTDWTIFWKISDALGWERPHG